MLDLTLDPMFAPNVMDVCIGRTRDGVYVAEVDSAERCKSPWLYRDLTGSGPTVRDALTDLTTKTKAAGFEGAIRSWFDTWRYY